MSSVPSTPEATTAIAGGGTVLVVEDEAFNRFLLRRLIADLGYVIAECTDGATALQAARERAPDVALIDVELPDVDGFSICRRLKTDPATADIQVIIVTARSDITDIEKGFEAGALDYIRKPFHPRELAVRVRNAMELRRRGDALRKWKDRTTRELALAAALQQTMQASRTFLHERLRVRTAYRPSTEVGGDFFDIVPLPDGRIGVYVGDVSGHGIGPAMVATLLKSSMSDYLPTLGAAGPAAVCNALHARFLQQVAMPNMFATMFLAIIDLETGHGECLSCGHPVPIVSGATDLRRGDIDRRGGPPIGLAILPENPFAASDEIRFTVPPGSILLFVTDGLLEAIPEDSDEMAGRHLLSEFMAEWAAGGQETAVDFVFRRMRERGYGIESDDCTALVCEFVAPAEIVFEQESLLTHEMLQRVSQSLETALRGAGWTEEASWAVALLLLEHGANVLRHGRPPAEARFRVQARLVRDTCELFVRDKGTPWDYTADARLPCEQAENGRGLFMIRRIASRIESFRHADENVTVFSIRRTWSPEL